MRFPPATDPAPSDPIRRRIESLFLLDGEDSTAGSGRGPRRALDDSARDGPWERIRDVGADHARVLLALAGVAVLVAVVLVLRARPVVSDVAVAAVPVVTPTPSAAASPSPALIRVHVLGAVQRPGLVSVPAGARVADVLTAAGGLTRDARPGELNLAAVVPDGAQILVGTKASPRGEVRVTQAVGATGGAAVLAPVDLNTATADQLDALPGVGPVTAQAILAWRAAHGRFSTVAQLQEVDGIGPKTYQDLAVRVRV